MKTLFQRKQKIPDVIFLDIDGVLNTKADWQRMYVLNPICMKHFLSFARGKQVVLTSSWRSGYAAQPERCSPQLQELMKQFEGANIQIIGRINDNPDRLQAILTYAEAHCITDYLIIDDDITEFSDKPKQLLLVDSTSGFAF